MNHDDAKQALNVAESCLDELQGLQKTLENALETARQKLSASLAAWYRLNPAPSLAQTLCDHVQAQSAIREQINNGTMIVHANVPAFQSRVDEQAYYQRTGRSHSAQGSHGFRRGGTPQRGLIGK
jgi:hypothetical protein